MFQDHESTPLAQGLKEDEYDSFSSSGGLTGLEVDGELFGGGGGGSHGEGPVGGLESGEGVNTWGESEGGEGRDVDKGGGERGVEKPGGGAGGGSRENAQMGGASGAGVVEGEGGGGSGVGGRKGRPSLPGARLEQKAERTSQLLSFNEVVSLCQSLFLDDGNEPPGV